MTAVAATPHGQRLSATAEGALRREARLAAPGATVDGAQVLPDTGRALFPAEIVEFPVGPLVVVLSVSMAGVVALLAETPTTLALIGAVALLIACAAAVIGTTLRMMGPVEHPDPTLDALLTDEGVANADRYFTQLLADQRPA